MRRAVTAAALRDNETGSFNNRARDGPEQSSYKPCGQMTAAADISQSSQKKIPCNFSPASADISLGASPQIPLY